MLVKVLRFIDSGDLLRELVTLTPGQLLFRAWLILLSGTALHVFKPLSGIAVATALVAVVGYPYIVALSLKSHQNDVRPSTITKILFYLFILVLVVASVGVPFISDASDSEAVESAGMEGWLSVALVMLVNLVVFAPFFLATHRLNEARRRSGSDPHLPSIPTFLGFYFGFFGGYLYVHRLVREVCHRGYGSTTPSERTDI